MGIINVVRGAIRDMPLLTMAQAVILGLSLGNWREENTIARMTQEKEQQKIEITEKVMQQMTPQRVELTNSNVIVYSQNGSNMLYRSEVNPNPNIYLTKYAVDRELNIQRAENILSAANLEIKVAQEAQKNLEQKVKDSIRNTLNVTELEQYQKMHPEYK